MNFRLFDSISTAMAATHARRKDWPIRPSAAGLAATDHIFDVPADAQAFVDRLYRLSIGAIAIDTEYRYLSPPVPLRSGGIWYDPSAMDPLILTGAAWVPAEGQVVRFLFDLRRPGMAAVVEHLINLRTVFVAHSIKSEFQALWALGLDLVLAQTYDTYVAARALLLGQGHKAIELKHRAAGEEDWESLAEAEAQIASLLSLTGQCEAYGIPHPFARSKNLLQASFLDHPAGTPFTRQQVDYALSDAEFTLRLYLAQQPDILAAGLHAHLHQVEFPYAEANARMEFDGVPVDIEKLAGLSDGLRQAVAREAGILRGLGLENPASSKEVIAFLCSRSLRERITVKGKLTSKDEVLEGIEALDPAIPHLRAYRRYRSLLGGQLLSGELIGSDDRFHPHHRHLGAETGRNTCSAPNVVGLSHHFRPVITAPPGRAIVEADYAQIEVGIAAAEAAYVELIQAFNSGDVYAAVAKTFYWADLSDEERQLGVADFKVKRPDLRKRIKTFVLATLYNMQDQAIADRFVIPLAEATRQREAFLARYPGVREMMRRADQDGRARGFAPVVGGMRRHVPPGHAAANKHMNTPVQAGAGVAFRRAVVDLYQHFRGTPTRLILPIHDAVAVECDAEEVAAVGRDLTSIMAQAVRRYYPELQPPVDLNDHDTTCWNKDGKGDALENFLMEARQSLVAANDIGVAPNYQRCIPN
jgi:DNA polymerase I